MTTPSSLMYPRDATFYDLLAEFIDYEPIASVDPGAGGRRPFAS
ncbi:hypothetical protein [Rhodococcus koreensis]